MRFNIVPVLLLLPLLQAAPPPTASAQRAIPQDNLSYPVQISLESGNEGSGFYLNERTATFLVTAGHVLFDGNTLRAPRASLLSYSREGWATGKTRLLVDLARLNAEGRIQRSKTHDVAIVKITKWITPGSGELYRGQLADGVQMVETTATGIVGVDVANLKPFAEVLVGNPIYIFGYPTSLGIPANPQIERDKPLLRAGVVAGTNGPKKTLILDCPAYGGNSGGPVFEVDTLPLGGASFHLVGVIVEFVPFDPTRSGKPPWQNSGYSIAAPTDEIRRLTSEAAAR